MFTIRSMLAFPFYAVAFILHLLTAAFTVVAQKVAGEDFETSRRTNIIMAAVVCCAVVAGLSMYVAHAVVPTDHTKALLIQPPNPQWRDVPTGFLPEQMAWVNPALRASACIFAFRAIRYYLEPAKVGFHGCGDKVNVTFDDRYYEVTVSGSATVDGKPQTFIANLNHYPPSTSEWAFVATDIKIGD